MAQIASIPSTASQAAPHSSPVGGKERLFSPHLQTAIANTQPQKETPSTDVQYPSMKGAAAPEDHTGNSQLIPFLPTKPKSTESEATPISLDLLMESAKNTANDVQDQGISIASQSEFENDSVVPYTAAQVTPSSDNAGNKEDISLLAVQPEEKEKKVALNTGSLVSPITDNEDNGDTYHLISSGFNFSGRVAIVPILSPSSLSLSSPASEDIFTSASTIAVGAVDKRIPGSGIAPGDPQDIRTAGDMLTNDFLAANAAKPGGIIPEDNLFPRFQEGQRVSDAESLKPGNRLSSLQMLGINPKDEALLVRLNEIINNSSETMRVSITRSTPSATPDPMMVSKPGQPAVDLLAIAAEEGSKLTPERSDQQSHPLRHNVQQQYYQAKIQSDSNGENAASKESPDQNSNGGNAPSPQTMALADKNSSATATDPASTLTQTATSIQETAGQTSPDTGKQFILPSGTYVREDHVVQQFMERFQVARRLAESKINIKLHPAELGELKIDLSVKEGSIKASVVTQNQQVQEIIERNIAKLRTMLEGQGYSLDAVTVTTESDSVGDFDLFDKQLFSHNDFTPSRTKSSILSETIFDPESIHVDEKDQSNGVNVRI